jgi:hypothetical protein
MKHCEHVLNLPVLCDLVRKYRSSMAVYHDLDALPMVNEWGAVK